MTNLMRTVTLLTIGVALGSVATARMAAQPGRDAGLRMNHVGISVKNVDESVRFYTKTFGFREAYTLRDKDGNPTMSYIQISRDTFLELAPASATRPAGLTHVGIEADDIESTVTRLRQAGAQVPDTRVPTNTNATITSLMDPDGVRVELLQLTPGSLQRKAIDTWK